jgi:hypothetical protein
VSIFRVKFGFFECRVSALSQYWIHQLVRKIQILQNARSWAGSGHLGDQLSLASFIIAIVSLILQIHDRKPNSKITAASRPEGMGAAFAARFRLARFMWS